MNEQVQEGGCQQSSHTSRERTSSGRGRPAKDEAGGPTSCRRRSRVSGDNKPKVWILLLTIERSKQRSRGNYLIRRQQGGSWRAFDNSLEIISGLDRPANRQQRQQRRPTNSIHGIGRSSCTVCISLADHLVRIRRVPLEVRRLCESPSARRSVPASSYLTGPRTRRTNGGNDSSSYLDR
jgi:hypothetical protein